MSIPVTLTARCNREMAAYEACNGVSFEPPRCGRPEGHHGPCRSAAALARKYAADVPRITAWKRERRVKTQQEIHRAILAAELREFDGYRRAA